MSRTSLRCGSRLLDLSRPQVMGILNITPDSFSDGGSYMHADAALDRAQAMVEAGAAIIDIGGESTRPGSEPVSVNEEIDRVVPLIETLADRLDAVISVDTSKPEVMGAAATAGAGMINDVWALRKPGALQVAAELDLPVCLMHMQGEPRSMQSSPRYRDVLAEVYEFFVERIEACRQVGIDRHRLILDPGFGFGKQLEHNSTLLREIDAFSDLGLCLLVGISRKSMLGELTGRSLGQRMPASLAAATIAVMKGAHIVRVHDVAATVDALKVCSAVLQPGADAE